MLFCLPGVETRLRAECWWIIFHSPVKSCYPLNSRWSSQLQPEQSQNTWEHLRTPAPVLTANAVFFKHQIFCSELRPNKTQLSSCGHVTVRLISLWKLLEHYRQRWIGREPGSHQTRQLLFWFLSHSINQLLNFKKFIVEKIFVFGRSYPVIARKPNFAILR